MSTSSMERVETASIGAASGYHRDSAALGHWVVTTRPSLKFTAVPGPCRRAVDDRQEGCVVARSTVRAVPIALWEPGDARVNKRDRLGRNGR